MGFQPFFLPSKWSYSKGKTYRNVELYYSADNTDDYKISYDIKILQRHWGGWRVSMENNGGDLLYLYVISESEDE